MRKSKLYLGLAAVCALMAVIPSTSAAAQFETSTQSYLEGWTTEAQNFSFGEGKEVVCPEAVIGGTMAVFANPLYPITTYRNCHWVGSSVQVEVSKAEYTYYASGKMDITKPVTLTVLIPLMPDCTITIEPQTGLTSLSFANAGVGINVNHAIKGIKYSSAGSYFCPSSGNTNGTLSGKVWVGVHGGTLKWQP